MWEWDLSYRWEWELYGNGNEVIEMGGNWYEFPAHLYTRPLRASSTSTSFCTRRELDGINVVAIDPAYVIRIVHKYRR